MRCRFATLPRSMWFTELFVVYEFAHHS